MSIYASTVLNKAISYIGTKEVPAGSNTVIFNTEYYGKKVKGDSYPWCCVFMWYVFNKCGASKLFYGGKKTAYCPTLENWFKKEKRYYASGQVGDICFMDFGKGRASHVGIVEKKNADGTYTIIEGNTSTSSNDNGGNVMRRTRNVKNIRGFGRPKYDVKVNTSAPKKTTTSYYKKYTGKSQKIDEVLKAIGVPSKYYGSWKKRKEIAKKNSIKDYTGTAKQNTTLISLAKQGKLKKV